MKITAALALLLSLSASRSALAQPGPAPVPQQSGSVEFLSGGVTETELAQIRSQASNYNLKVRTAAPSGAHIGSAEITIADALGGNLLLSTRARGPLFYARLPEGRYVVTAKSGNQVQRKTVRVGSAAAPEVTLTLAATENRVANPAATASPGSRARVKHEGVSLYDLDPSAAARAKTQVNRYEASPDGTNGARSLNEVPGGRSVDEISEAVTNQGAPVEPGVETQAADPGTGRVTSPGARPRH